MNYARRDDQVPLFYTLEPFDGLQGELAEGLSRYWWAAGRLLQGSGITLRDPPPSYCSIETNLFSALFLYSYLRAGIPRTRRIFYAAVNQCLRGMVTGCDNLLDDEYKVTLETDLPEDGTRFRSVLDIMVSDRVLFELLVEAADREEIHEEHVLLASAASLRALAQSGAQEASEEAGIAARLEPQIVLDAVHRLKTGILFQCPWAVPELIEDLGPDVGDRTKDALYWVGIGCQILDDVVDLARDLRGGRHNYLASLVYHGSDPVGWLHLQAQLPTKPEPTRDRELPLVVPSALSQAVATARDYLEVGLKALFASSHQHLVAPAIWLLAERIGAAQYLLGDGP